MATPDTTPKVHLVITAASDGGFTVSDPSQTPFGGVTNLLFAGNLAECLRYIERSMSPPINRAAGTEEDLEKQDADPTSLVSNLRQAALGIHIVFSPRDAQRILAAMREGPAVG